MCTVTSTQCTVANNKFSKCFGTHIKCEINQLQQTPWITIVFLQWINSQFQPLTIVCRFVIRFGCYTSKLLLVANVRWMVNKCDIIKLWWTAMRSDWTILLPFLLSPTVSVCSLQEHWALTSFDVHWKRTLWCLTPDAWCIVNIIYFYDHVHFDNISHFESSTRNWLQQEKKIPRKYKHIFLSHGSWIMDHHKVTFLFNLPHKQFSHAHCLCYWIKAHNQSNGKCLMGLTVFYKIRIFCYLQRGWITLQQNPNGF